jgi:hypothetical protein
MPWADQHWSQTSAVINQFKKEGNLKAKESGLSPSNESDAGLSNWNQKLSPI